MSGLIVSQRCLLSISGIAVAPFAADRLPHAPCHACGRNPPHHKLVPLIDTVRDRQRNIIRRSVETLRAVGNVNHHIVRGCAWKPGLERDCDVKLLIRPIATDIP